MMIRRTPAILLAIALCAASFPGAATATDPAEPWPALAERFGGARSDTRPSRDVTMRFSFSTEVRRILVKPGQRVAEGDPLVSARDADIQAALRQQKMRAENDLEIQAAAASLELARFRFEHAERALREDSFSIAEFEERRIDYETAKINLEAAKMRLEEEKIRLEQIEGQYERFLLAAPFDGVVEEVFVELGQGVNEQAPAVRIVNTELLWLDASTDTSETIRLGLDERSPAWVLLDIGGEAKLVKGSVLFVSPVADPVSETRRVRVEVPNVENWPAGTQARVRFTEPSAQWAAYAVLTDVAADTARATSPPVPTETEAP